MSTDEEPVGDPAGTQIMEFDAGTVVVLVLTALAVAAIVVIRRSSKGGEGGPAGR